MTELISLFSLSSKVAIVTGASRGIGCEIALGLASAGATVIGVARSEQPESLEPHMAYMCCDVKIKKQFEDVVERVYLDHKKIDILVNAAGATYPIGSDQNRLDHFENSVAVNLTAVFNCCDATIPKMLVNGKGSIINVTSIGAGLGFPDNPGYVASKGGVTALTRALARDYGARGIRVNNLVPGYFRTEMTKVSFANETLREQRAARTMMGRWGDVRELRGAAIFLSSESSSYVTGADIVVDGGWTSMGL